MSLSTADDTWFPPEASFPNKRQEVSDLGEICLSVIAENFEKYCVALKRSSHSSVLRRNWESVARRFSETLFHRLKSDMKLRSEHLDYLINPYVKDLDLVGIDGTLLPSLIDKLQAHGKNILSLKAMSGDFEEAWYEPLTSSLPNVESIEFSTYRSSKILEPIGRNCPFLKVLTLDTRDLHSRRKHKHRDGISFVITHCPRLEVLEFYDTVGALYKTHKSNLDSERQKKSFGNFLRQKKSLKQCKKYALTNLYSTRRNYPLRDALEVCVVVCPDVSTLHIDHVRNDLELEQISRFALLENVKLNSMFGVSFSCFNQFLKLRGSKLTSLDLAYVSCLSVPTLAESCPTLQSLKLRCFACRGCSRKDEPDGSCLPDLKILEFSNCMFSDQEISEALKLILEAARRMRRLSLTESSGLTDEFFSSLDLNHIHELDVSSSDVVVDPLRELLLNGKLRKLNVEKCRNVTLDDYISLTRCRPGDGRTVVDIKWSLPDSDEKLDRGIASRLQKLLKRVPPEVFFVNE